MESQEASTDDGSGGPLSGLRVLDLSRVLAGPFLTQSLAALGADVVKVEPPDGDPTRRQGPPELDGVSYYFHGTNGGKRSVVLDLEAAAGREVAWKLAERADVLVENFRPGVLARLGLEPDELRRANPKLVILSISGLGDLAPPAERERPSFDLTTQARSGVLSINGRPGELPVRLAIPMGDLAGALMGGIALLASLLRRERTGAGGRIDLSLLDAQVSLLGTWISLASLSGRAPGPVGSAHTSAAPYDVYEARDGLPFVVAVFTDRFWPPFVEALGEPSLASDPRFATGASRVSHRAELDGIVRARFRANDRSEWLTRLSKSGVPAEAVATIPEALADPALNARKMVRREGRGARAHARMAFPARIDGKVGFASPAPAALGAHRDEVLREWIGFSPSQIRAAAKRGAFGRKGGD